MPISDDPSYQYNMTIKMFGSEPEPPFETPQELTRVWGRNWGVDNDVGQNPIGLDASPRSGAFNCRHLQTHR
jgi:hypothetical protein